MLKDPQGKELLLLLILLCTKSHILCSANGWALGSTEIGRNFAVGSFPPKKDVSCLRIILKKLTQLSYFVGTQLIVKTVALRSWQLDGKVIMEHHIKDSFSL